MCRCAGVSGTSFDREIHVLLVFMVVYRCALVSGTSFGCEIHVLLVFMGVCRRAGISGTSFDCEIHVLLVFMFARRCFTFKDFWSMCRRAAVLGFLERVSTARSMYCS